MYPLNIQRQMIRFLPVCCLLIVMAGCASFGGLKANPKVSVADIRVQDVKAMESVFLLQLRVLNPNEVPLNLHGISCDLEIDGRKFASGIADSNQIIPAYGSTVVPVNVYASVLDMVSSVMDLVHTANNDETNEKPVHYVLKGTVDVGIHGFHKDIPFTSSGKLSLHGLPLPN